MKKKKINKRQQSELKTIISLVLIVLAVLLFFALTSFYMSGSSDRSFFECSLWELITNPDLECSNLVGRYGAWISDLLVNRLIGVSSYVIPFLMVMGGLNLFSNRNFRFFNVFVKSVIISMWLSVVLGFVFYSYTDSQFPIMGGLYGYYMAKWLMSALGVFGTIVVVIILLPFIYLVLTTERVNDWYRNTIFKLSSGKISLSKMLFLSDDSYANSTFGSESEDEIEEEEEEDEEEEHEEFAVEEEEEMEEEEDENERVYNNRFDKENDKDDDEEEDTEKEDVAIESSSDDEFQITKAVGDEESNIDVRGSLNTPYDPTLDLEHYKMPDFDLLDNSPETEPEEVSESYLRENKNKIVEAFRNFSIEISSIKATVGPTVTLYEIVPAPGTRISKIQSLENDIAMSLSALGIRIIAPIPGQGTVGIEVPNKKPQTVSMVSVLKSKKFQESKYELPVAMGKTISNEVFAFDLTKTPHLLVAGATGQGKSVGLNALITSLLYKKHPSQIKFVMVDPKRVELSIYRKLEKHFMAKMPSEDDVIITDVERVKTTLNSLTVEMDSRYELLQKVDVRNIKEYNEKFIKRQLNPADGHRFLPYIVVIVDEFADLIMVVGKEIEKPIARIAQKARAVGIHMILATQRPSADVITGVIKANFPARIAFKVSAMQDSRTIIDTSGAQNLIGRGDMLCQVDGSMVRVQCAFVSTEEVMSVSEYISTQQGYGCAYELPDVDETGEGGGAAAGAADMGAFDPMLREAAKFVTENNSGSTSQLQRRLSIGFNRAGRLMDQLERVGVVGPQKGSKPRDVLVGDLDGLERILQGFGL
jgi:S-DNA-T family DNA segregation ATPase FtsK/SpoIIIE